ncbi:unnamed protein product [Anisakis simplex]|uniref:Integrator complex subunit 6-like beta-barrel domain-containing protein n=1 Tax=Anisakis simplex TaxID=6269 RepID=A0A3P6T3Z2_ANISI|nr:unnamed protein product [Anisakis simplex]
MRLSGSLPSNAKIVSGMNIPFDNSPIDAMCAATGGRSFCITSHKMLGVCVDTIVQKMQQHGALVHFQQVGADPAPPISERINGAVENGVAKRNGEVEGMSKKSVADDGGWRNVLTTISSRVSSRSYLGNWPIPEVFWPDKNMMSLPPRKAHPTIMFRCDDCDPLVCQEFPFDKYELEPSPLTQFILERKQPNVCWQVFVANSSQPGTNAAPFGYLKAATNLQSVNLFLMPYNYPILLPLVEEIKQDPRLRTNQAWKLRLEKYIASAPCYYLAPLKKAFQRFNVTTSTLESDHSSQYSYNVLSYITKMKHTAREEFESNCTTVASALQQPANLPSNMIQISESKTRSIPSIKFRNPFEIKRSQLIDQVEKMRINLGLHLRDTNVSALIGGKPGTNIKLHHAEDLHNLPKSIAVDEVGEGNILGVASKGDTHKKRSNSSSVTSQSSSRPPRRKPGPLARNALSLWRIDEQYQFGVFNGNIQQ